ncbi:hypothetical protein AVEN_135097-1 [Araneus ventricosus]|uniref:Uncharacterized protein n=1 Tax=Araneus ventricosus TaxID=182803 RepID=A0A4Y2M5C7_ARAVE|nr:hypothetical protein AVEN_135097-1 [Araneus ventricosus]
MALRTIQPLLYLASKRDCLLIRQVLIPIYEVLPSVGIGSTIHRIQNTLPLSPSARTWAGKGGVCELTTIQRQHSQGNQLSVLGTPDPELVNQGHAMSKHSRAHSHHPLFVTDPHWATPTPTPPGQ